jgi:hypothetical protein
LPFISRTENIHTMKRTFTILALAAASLSAQSLFTTGDLKRACETSPNNTVNITSEVKIESGTVWPAVEQVATGCTFTFTENSGLQLKQVAIRFAGPLTLQSSRKANLEMFESYAEARSINLQLFGRGSKILLGQSRMVANNGNFAISIWEDTLVDIFDRFGPQASLPVIQTSGMFSIWTDASTISFKNAAVSAGTGVDINLADELPTFKSEETDFVTSAGTVAIYGRLRDIKIEINKGRLSGPGGVRVTLGRQSAMGLKDVAVNGGNGPVTLGVDSFSSSAEISQGNIQTNGIVEFQAGSFSSTINVDGNTIRGNGGISVTAGAQGSNAIAKNNNVTSATSFRVSAGFSSSCDASGNVINSPVQSLCR